MRNPQRWDGIASAGESGLRAPSSLVLASGSPRRAVLMGKFGIPFQIVVSGDPETLAPGLSPAEQALHLARQKASAVAATLPHGLIIGADTVVAIDQELLGKPRDDTDAVRMLRALRGREHKVITGVALVDAATGEIASRAVNSIVHVRHLSDEEIAAYVATGEPADKAGAYAIQGIGSHLIAGLEGCFNNVVGLPMCAVAALLADAGLKPSPAWQGCRLPDGSPCPNVV